MGAINMVRKSLFEKLESIKNGWDRAATEDAVNYILGSKRKRDLDLKTFFDRKAQQAKRDTEEFFKEMHFTPAGKRMLDIGCGIGAMTRYFSEIFGEAHGVDISEEMIKKAIDLNRDRHNLFFKTNNGADLSIYEDNFFDFCFSVATFQYFPSKKVIESYFKEISRILKKGGCLRFNLMGESGLHRGSQYQFIALCITSCVIPYS